MTFRDRSDAGIKLAERLKHYRGQDVIVYALPRGGVALGVHVAKSLGAPLDLIVVRKIGHPDNPEYAIAAVADDGHIESNTFETQDIEKEWFDNACRVQQSEACRRRDLYLAGRIPLNAEGKIAILVDDGLATGLTMALAIREVRHRHPSRVVVAVPVASSDSIAELRELADDIVVLHVPDDGFHAIGAYYQDFPQLTDEEVANLVNKFGAKVNRGQCNEDFRPGQIYEKFMELEERTATIYVRFASHFSGNPELSAFWLEMAMHEKQHAGLLQFCLAEKFFAENLPDDATIQAIETRFRSFESRAADPALNVPAAFQIALELESSEVNDIYCHLTSTTHTSVYLWHRKIATLPPGHIGYLADSARKFGAGDEVVRKLDLLNESCV